MPLHAYAVPACFSVSVADFACRRQPAMWLRKRRGRAFVPLRSILRRRLTPAGAYPLSAARQRRPERSAPVHAADDSPRPPRTYMHSVMSPRDALRLLHAKTRCRCLQARVLILSEPAAEMPPFYAARCCRAACAPPRVVYGMKKVFAFERCIKIEKMPREYSAAR